MTTRASGLNERPVQGRALLINFYLLIAKHCNSSDTHTWFLIIAPLLPVKACCESNIILRPMNCVL